MMDRPLRKTLLGLFVIPLAHCSSADDQSPQPEDTEVWDPEPAMVVPGDGTSPPADAIILLGDEGANGWRQTDGGELTWRVEEGVMTVVPGTGNVETEAGFGDVQLHVEWRAPADAANDGQDRGNSGIFLQKRYEVQVLDSYDNRTYANGQASAIYKQHIPLVNASRPPGAWQTYDIIFEAPEFAGDGTVERPAFITVIHNGVLVQNHVEVQGETVYIGQPSYTAHPAELPLMLQDHDSPVSFRNIWVRRLD